MDASNLREIESTLTELPFPKKFAVETCAECNLACTMCHHPTMRRPKGTMPLALWRKCANEIAEVRPHTECWFSFCGEPLLAPRTLINFLNYGKSAGLQSLNVNTNGILLSPDFCAPLLDTGLDLIVFGIDGFTKETYEKIRVGGDRDQLYRNVEAFIEERDRRRSATEVQVQFIEMDENEHELETFKAYWLERGATVKVRRQLSWGGRLGSGLDASKLMRIPCPWALTMMHVFWDGRIARCPGDTEGEEGFGNAWHEPLAELWNKLAPYRKKHLQHRFDELPERCHTCTDWATGAAERIRPNHQGTWKPAVA